MNVGQIVKSKTTEKNFTIISNDIIRSTDLTLCEKGLLIYLLQLPPDWVLYKKNLYNALPDLPGSIDRYFKGLQDKGYIVSVKVINESAQFIGWNHVVYDDPVKDLPKSVNTEVGLIEKPKPEFTEVGKSSPILSTNTILSTKEETKNEDFSLVSLKTKQNKENISAAELFEKRKLAFYCRIKTFKGENPDKYPAKIYNDFYRWWTESDGKEMRFENKKNRYFEVGKRLATFWGRLSTEEKSRLWQLEKDKPKTGMLL